MKLLVDRIISAQLEIIVCVQVAQAENLGRVGHLELQVSSLPSLYLDGYMAQ
jgi:hypothetical protein